MNKSLIAERFSKATATYTQEATVQKQIAHKMAGLLQKYVTDGCPQILEVGCGTGVFSRLVMNTFRPQQFYLNDLCEKMGPCCADLLQHSGVSFLPGDAESIPFPSSLSLITSCSTLQWFEQPNQFFERCEKLLSNGGFLAFSTFGPDNFHEIRTLTGNGLPYRSCEELTQELNRHFDLVYAEEEKISLSFSSPLQVLQHLKQTGVNGISRTQPANATATSVTWTKGDLAHFQEQYVRLFGQSPICKTGEDQGTTHPAVSLTYHPIYIIVKKKRK